jgi:hypothetical protein
MNRKSLLTFILFTAVFIIPALPPATGASPPPGAAQTQAAALDYYDAARTILYASLAISGANVAFAYHFYGRGSQGKEP